MTAVRRSGRTRRQAQTIYDEANRALSERKSRTKDNRAKKDDDASKDAIQEDETETESLMEEQEQSSASEESSDEEMNIQAKKQTRKSSSAKKQPVKVASQPKKPAAKSRSATGTTTRRGLQSALTSLARKVLESDETPENSLVAALLQSHRASRAAAKQAQRHPEEQNRTPYTVQLEQTARGVLEQHQADPNKAQIVLLNLLFRSVGGSVETNLDPDKVTLEDMDNEQWGKIITDLVDEMRHTPAERVLLCADPDGAVHAAAIEASKDPNKVSTIPSAAGVREYRKIYEEFWYRLGSVALSEGFSLNEDEDNDEESISADNDHGFPKNFTSTSRFNAELVRELIMRIIELASVGQPDVRAAASVAVLQMGHALLDHTTVLSSKIDTATRQFAAAGGKKQKGGLSRKAESLRHQIDSLKRTRTDLEELVLGPITEGVFIHRYRDSNMHIRAACMNALSRMTLQRPDLFLRDKYLKYFGWMVSDKSACVRIASLAGLLVPFQAVQDNHKSGLTSSDVVNLMENVVSKFLPRIVDCVIDVSTVVQEKAMALLLALMREGLLDDLEGETLWNQINLRALSRDASPVARRDALYFVIEQLEAFDDGGAELEDTGRGRSSEKKTSAVPSSERTMAQRLDGLASWVAHTLSDGPIPIEKMQVDLADFVVHSVRSMPEHKSLVTNWSTMLRAISDDSAATTAQGSNAGDRADVAKQRVLVQMLACAAQAEVGAVADSAFLLRNMDPDVVATTPALRGVSSDGKSTKTKRGGAHSSSEGMPHEVLSVALLKSLPKLLVKFKSDSTVLGSLASLPRYLLPSVFSLPQRKRDFTALIKNLSEIYLESPDDTVLRNTALSLTFLSRGDHARAPEARLQLQRVTTTLRERLLELFTEGSYENKGATKKRKGKGKQSPSKRRRRNRASSSSQSSASSTAPESEDEHEEISAVADVEYAIYLCLKRLRVLSKRTNISDLLEMGNEDVVSDSVLDDEIEVLFNGIVEGITHRLKERKVSISESATEEITIPDLWKKYDKNVHGVVANSVKEALCFLLSVTAWKLHEAQEQDGVLLPSDEDLNTDTNEEADDVEDHVVLRLRDKLIALVELCFEQFLPLSKQGEDEERADPGYSLEQIDFADSVQMHAGQIAADVRTLFPKKWADASSPLLRACALTEDGRLIGGFVRYFRTKENMIRAIGQQEKEDADLVHSLLLPMGRSLATNWSNGNRREAGVVLAHVTGSGHEASDVVSAMSRVLKKIEPVRLLEAHMASLRQSYEDWFDNEPELENDRPTDQEMAAFEEAEQKHDKQFQALEQQAFRFSSSLGVGKLSDPKLSPALLGFVREGLRFAFSNTEDNGDDELLLGSRLSFLSILSRYANWIRRNKDQQAVIGEDLEQRERALRAHQDFAEVHQDDLAALANFRAALGLKDSTTKESSPRSIISPSQDSLDAEDDGDLSPGVTPNSDADRSTSLRMRLSRGSSVSSMKSRVSTQSTLSPLYEERASVDGADEEELSPSPSNRRGGTRRRALSLESSISHSTFEAKTIEEMSEESSDEGSQE